MKDGARTAKRYGLTGYVPSLEPWSYVVTHEEFGESHLTGKRLKPFGLDWLADGAMPLRDCWCECSGRATGSLPAILN